jgi:UDP-perosamine 4-acetyltransferase
MQIINVPKIINNDIEIRLCSILLNKEYVNKGEIYCELETSKATYEVESDHSGFIYFLYDEGSTIKVGHPFALVSNHELTNNEIDQEKKKLFNDTVTQSSKSHVITKKAKLLIEKHKLDISLFTHELITEAIVLEYIKNTELKNNKKVIHFNENDIVIIGIGGHASTCIDIILSKNDYNLVGYLDDGTYEDKKYGLPWLGTLNDINDLINLGLKNVIIGIGFVNNARKKQELYDKLKDIVNIPTIIHKNAIIEPTANIEKGCQIFAGATIGSYVNISENCMINAGSIVCHDTYIDKGSHITPGAILAGNIHIGKCVTIGMGASIYLGVTISDYMVIPNGKSVYENI